MTSVHRLLPTLALLTLATSACAHVGREEYQADLAELRAEVDSRLERVEESSERNRDEITRIAERLQLTDGEVEELRADFVALERDFDVRFRGLEELVAFNVPVYFDFDEAAVDERGSEILSRFAAIARRWYPEAQITVEGYTDATGPAPYNEVLGQRRAEAVKRMLVMMGLESERVATVSHGEAAEHRVAPVEGAHWENRRVTLLVGPPAVAAAAAPQTDESSGEPRSQGAGR